jgi:hypothetical protein
MNESLEEIYKLIDWIETTYNVKLGEWWGQLHMLGSDGLGAINTILQRLKEMRK